MRVEAAEICGDAVHGTARTGAAHLKAAICGRRQELRRAHQHPFSPKRAGKTIYGKQCTGGGPIAEVRDAQLKSAGRDPCALPSERASHIATCPEYHVERNRTMHKNDLSPHAAPHDHGPPLTPRPHHPPLGALAPHITRDQIRSAQRWAGGGRRRWAGGGGGGGGGGAT